MEEECKKKMFAILGHEISYSVSPAMHNAAFAALNLPHSYDLIDVETVEEFVQSDFWRNKDLFGGLSVTVPHKQSIIPHLDRLSDAAQIIGAVNTIVVDPTDGSRTGENTDWKGIYNPIHRRLHHRGGVALILGAGGTARAAAHAATQLGLDRIYWNRTPSKAQELVSSFGGTVASSLHETGENSLGHILHNKKQNGDGLLLRVIISTLPASANFELPLWLLPPTHHKDDNHNSNYNVIIVLDVNYKPYWTKLLRQADSCADGMEVIRGSEMLWEQGVQQFELWTKQTAPYDLMKHIVLKNCLPNKGNEDE